jgi:hypothetical protein
LRKKEIEKKTQKETMEKDLRDTWLKIKGTQYPTRPDEIEQFFLALITEAEVASQQGTTQTWKQDNRRAADEFACGAEVLYCFEGVS